MPPDGAGVPARLPVVGLTGGIACGKSEVASLLAGLDVPVLDTDTVAHEVIQPGGEAYDEVVEAFGPGILREDGRIDRGRLGHIGFS